MNHIYAIIISLTFNYPSSFCTFKYSIHITLHWSRIWQHNCLPSYNSPQHSAIISPQKIARFSLLYIRQFFIISLFFHFRSTVNEIEDNHRQTKEGLLDQVKYVYKKKRDSQCTVLSLIYGPSEGPPPMGKDLSG